MGRTARSDPEEVMIIFLVILGFGSAIGGDPGVFADYFDDTIREVDIPQSTAILGCLENGRPLVNKMNEAYEKCFGADYSISQLAANNGPDRNGDGFPDSFNGNEGCFYKEMGWVAGSTIQADVIKSDMEGLSEELKAEFEGNIDECAAWSGDFNNRLRRNVDDSLPAILEEEVLGRVVRQIPGAGPKAGRGARPVVKTGPGAGRGAEPVVKKRPETKKRPGAGRGAEPVVKKRPETKNRPGAGRGTVKRKGTGIGPLRSNNLLEESVYNVMWCFDLSMEQILEKCVAEKLEN